MAQSALVVLLVISMVIEAALAAAGFVAPDWAIGQFRLGVTPDTSFLAYIVAWFALVVAAVCGLACVWVRRGERSGWTLSFVLGAWWVAIGLGIFIAYRRPEHLVADTLKGLLIVGFAWASRPGARPAGARALSAALLATLCAAAGTQPAAAGESRCALNVSGDLHLKVTAGVAELDRDASVEDRMRAARVSATTDYWMTEKSIRLSLESMTKAFDGLKTSSMFKNGKVDTQGIQDQARKSAAKPTTEAESRKVEEAMRKDPRLVLLLLNCGNDELSIALTPVRGSRYADVPFKPAKYRIMPQKQAKPGDFSVLMHLTSQGKSESFEVSAPGTIELEHFDARGVAGHLSFQATRAYGLPRHKVSVEGAFQYACKGDACQK